MSTLFHPFQKGILNWPETGQSVLFMHAQTHVDLGLLGPSAALYQPFKPYAMDLESLGHSAASGIPDGSYDMVLALMPKNKDEAAYIAARALLMLRPGGLFVCAADNKAGGGRLKKMLQNFGLAGVQDDSKNKARVCWARVDSYDEKAVKSAQKAGDKQAVLGGDFISQPGIFGWNKIDKGSEILLRFLPDNLKGRGADFGCGYGYLSAHIVKTHGGVESLLAADADARALECCAETLSKIAAQTRCEFLWRDLTRDISGLENLDFIVMNPPFHEGKATDISIGKTFIYNAYKALKPGGALYMVANAHLPYEGVLDDQFSAVDKIFEGEGFKIFAAKK
ncbi:MAG: class I SAM-dependent methyltransferase [Alphaproteobacteria bacterium]|nr:class I SAM-dependent methyltransferase [Alphaproteobacteria bacterium]